MNLVDPRLTVAEIVAAHPAAGPVLARFGLDTCCGGKHPLEHACRAHRLALDEVLRALEAVLAPAVAPAVPPARCACPHPSDESAPAPDRPAIGPETIVRDLVKTHPGAAAVLARHGLMGCGGSEGPVEPLAWFARVHDVPLPQLIDELRAAAAGDPAEAGQGSVNTKRGGTGSGAIDPRTLQRENLYRRFLKTALLFTLTGGTALGAWALVMMALRGHLGGIDRGIIQVHGHWQLVGWVGLFVVGIAYHILPRLTGVPLPSHRAAAWSYALLTLGTVLRFAQSIDPGPARSVLLLAGAGLETGGAALFAWTVARILRAARPLAPYLRFLAHGTAWLVVATLLHLAHAADLVQSGRFEVSSWLNVPYLTVFLVGFVTFWIFGVSLRTLPVFMGLHDRPRLAAALAAPLSIAVAATAIAEGGFLRTGAPAAAVLFGAGLAALAGLMLTFVVALGALTPRRDAPEPGVDRGYENYVRLAYAWLVVAALMLLAFAAVTLSGRGIDHAYVGAYRHALTVGFITTLMVGMAQRIVPVFRGVPLHSTRLLHAIFWLLAIGNVIRVLFQSLSAAFGPAWLRVAGVSGLLELAALVLFAVNLWKTMNAETADDRAAASVRPPIAAEARVGDLLEAYPALLPVFVRSGFAALANPVLRRTVAKGVSVGQACRMHGVDIEGFLGRLRAEIGAR